MSSGDDATLPDTQAKYRSPRMSAPDLGERYEIGEVIGRGGMGEVRLAKDRRIQREVAVKLMRDTSTADDAVLARFFREARVQGVLDHPAVVPVHDLGIDSAGNPFFVMKKLAGITLADVLVSPDPEVQKRWPRRQLLARLVDICLAIQFAHEHDVIHRDLKPANIMLGEYGEAYVLDWGLARVMGDRRIEGDGNVPSVGASGDETRAGDLLGTPGYMSPEQARGETVDARTDVFALGCVLFEILVGKPGLPRGVAGVQATLDLVELRPSQTTAEVPPELDDLCARATSGDRTNRPTARALADGIQAYLDGDRDHARRKELADAMARRARARISKDAQLADDVRAEIMRDAGRALALDPENATAQGVLGYLLQPTSGPIPAEALAAADAERALARQEVLKWARGAFAGLVGLTAVLFFMPLHHTWPVVVTFGVAVAAWGMVWKMGVRPLPMRHPYYLAFITLTSLSLLCGAFVIGPLFVLPIIIIGAISGFVAQPAGYSAWTIVLSLLVPIALPVTLELAGVVPSTFSFESGHIQFKTWVMDLSSGMSAALFFAAIVIQTLNSTLVAVFQRRAQEAAQNQNHAYKWHFERMLPKSTADETGRVTKS